MPDMPNTAIMGEDGELVFVFDREISAREVARMYFKTVCEDE